MATYSTCICMWIYIYFSFNYCNTSESTHVDCLHTGADCTLNFYISTIVTMSPFDDPRSQQGSLCFAPNSWQVTTKFSLFLPRFRSLGVTPSFFLTSPSLNWEAILSLASRAEILSSVLVCHMAGLMPCCSQSFLSCICCSLVMEFQTALGYFLHSTFPIKATNLCLTGRLLAFEIQTDCMIRPFFVTTWPR